MSLFGPDISIASVKFNNFRVYGTFLVIILGTIVFFGVKLVNKFATVALVCVLFTIFSIFLGIGINMNGNHKAEYVSYTQCGNFIIFLSFRFYVKSILGILEVQNLPF